MSDQIPTPETDAALSGPYGEQWSGVPGLCRRLERERNSAKTLNRSLLDQLEAQAKQIEAMRFSLMGAQQGAEEARKVIKKACEYQDQLSDAHIEIVEKLERERDEALALLASEKSTRNAIIKKGVEIEKQIEAMREAIGVAHEALILAPYCDQEALAKLQPFLKP